jgi:hypothetical protein
MKLTPESTPGKLKVVYQHTDHFSEKLTEHLHAQANNNEMTDMHDKLVNFTMTSLVLVLLAWR